jgi:hypothetical protein
VESEGHRRKGVAGSRLVPRVDLDSDETHEQEEHA